MLAVTQEILAARAKWRYRGTRRPPFAVVPGSGLESVWDYPRPPRIEPDPRRIRVVHGDLVLAESTAALRILETASPPTFYLPPDDVAVDRLRPSGRRSRCEWKGLAQAFELADIQGAAWSYAETFPEFAAIAGFFSFHAAKVRCTVSGEAVRPQPGGYYGGWITAEVIGPFKGEPGSRPWW